MATVSIVDEVCVMSQRTETVAALFIHTGSCLRHKFLLMPFPTFMHGCSLSTFNIASVAKPHTETPFYVPEEEACASCTIR